MKWVKKWGQKRARNSDPFLEPASKILILARIPKAQKTVPFFGPTFWWWGTTFELVFWNWMQTKKYRPMSPVPSANAPV